MSTIIALSKFTNTKVGFDQANYFVIKCSNNVPSYYIIGVSDKKLFNVQKCTHDDYMIKLVICNNDSTQRCCDTNMKELNSVLQLSLIWSNYTSSYNDIKRTINDLCS